MTLEDPTTDLAAEQTREAPAAAITINQPPTPQQGDGDVSGLKSPPSGPERCSFTNEAPVITDAKLIKSAVRNGSFPSRFSSRMLLSKTSWIYST